MVPVAGIPPPPPPELTLKMTYEPMRPSFYISLWDVLLYLDDVSAAGWASGIGSRNLPNAVLDEQSHSVALRSLLNQRTE